MPRLASSSRYCRVSGTGYRGVRARPKGTYYAEIRDGGERIGLGTYETVGGKTPEHDDDNDSTSTPLTWAGGWDVPLRSTAPWRQRLGKGREPKPAHAGH
ncbi:hypothetical protein QYE76_037609 [Lolium multiflorum]|uniref:AP2/ERF domain-containing protein n=1 Tax=Lolium multiflorum TaxID=4521 RepID=A0AAD8PGW1_LOLMU|nr:hypothetical protein QYE76_037609 [Lolium multiflorum]